MLGIAECLSVSSKLLSLRLSVHVACKLRLAGLGLVPLSSEGF